MGETVTGFPFLMIGSISCSTIQILLVKFLMITYRFDFPIALITFQIACSYSVLEILCRIGLFQRSENYTSKLSIIVSFENFLCLIFLNFSLKLNSIGLYTILTLLSAPGIVIVNLFLFKGTSQRTCIPLILLLIGVALFIVGEAYFTFSGIIFALLATFFFSIFQVNSNSILNQYHIRYPEYQLANSGYMIFYGIIATMFIEGRYPHTVFEYCWSTPELIISIITGIISVFSTIFDFRLAVNCSYFTYQIVEHAKTIAILIFGMIFIDGFGNDPYKIKIRKIVGVSLGMAGAILYTVCVKQEKDEHPKKEHKEDLDIKYEANSDFQNDFNVVDSKPSVA